MSESQHGRGCGCSGCAPLARAHAPHRGPDPATVEQLRLSYETALDEMQLLVEAGPEERETRIEEMRRFLLEAGRLPR